MINSDMKKTAIVLSSVTGFFASAVQALAQEPEKIQITPPKQGIAGNTELGVIISNAMTIIFTGAILLVLFYLVIGAFEWITSGGEKESVGKARGKIINALIGLAILALAFLIARVAGNIVNIDIFNLTLPTLNSGSR